MKARSRTVAARCLPAEFLLGEILVNRVHLAAVSGFGSSKFTISHLAMHPTPRQEKYKLHISCCSSGDIHHWPQPTSSSPSCSPHSSPSKAVWGLHRDVEEPHEVNGLGCSQRSWFLLLQNITSSANYAVKSQGLVLDTQQTQAHEHAMGKAHGSMLGCMLGHILRSLH